MDNKWIWCHTNIFIYCYCSSTLNLSHRYAMVQRIIWRRVFKPVLAGLPKVASQLLVKPNALLENLMYTRCWVFLRTVKKRYQVQLPYKAPTVKLPIDCRPVICSSTYYRVYPSFEPITITYLLVKNIFSLIPTSQTL